MIRHARGWGVSIDKIRATETSLLGFGTRSTRQVVLKVIRKQDSEEWRSGEILSAFDGHGLIRPIEQVDGAVLLPRLVPGDDLSSLSLGGRDEHASEIIAMLIHDMWTAAPVVADVGSVERLQPDFVRFREGGIGIISPRMIERAEALFAELCGTQRNPRLLHGDLHHYNVLFDAASGWVVIDPWGAMGEGEFEIGASLRNPIDAPYLLQDPRVIERRLQIYKQHLKFDADRALQWAFATTVLAILWPVDECLGVDMRVPFGAAAHAMVQLLE